MDAVSLRSKKYCSVVFFSLHVFFKVSISAANFFLEIFVNGFGCLFRMQLFKLLIISCSLFCAALHTETVYKIAKIAKSFFIRPIIE